MAQFTSYIRRKQQRRASILPKRQKVGKGRSTAKRRQNADEKEAKVEAKEEHADAIKASTTVVLKPCPRCTKDSQEADKFADAILMADPSYVQDPAATHARLSEGHQEYRRLRALALERLEQARTHARPTNKDCPFYIPRQKVQTQTRIGTDVKLRTVTIKHGLFSLLRSDIADQDKTAIFHAIGQVVAFNRILEIHAMAFARFYITAILQSDPAVHVPRALFSPDFFHGVFQLLTGGEWTNTKIFGETERDMLFLVFSQFRTRFPQIVIGKMLSPAGLPASPFTDITAYTAIQLSTCLKNHVIEDFSAFMIDYLQAEFMRRHDDLKPGHARQYAIYTFDTSARDDKFPAEAPNPKLRQEVKEALMATANELAAFMDTKWEQVEGWVAAEKTRMEEATRIRQERAREAHQATLAARVAHIAGMTNVSNSADDSLGNAGTPGTSSSSEEIDGGADVVDATTEEGIDTPTHDQDGAQPATTGDSPASPSTATRRMKITTATLTKYPHFFMRLLYDVLQTMEAWNDQDEARPAEPRDTVTYPWVHHQLAADVDEWGRLKRRKRSQLTHLVADLINSGVALDPARLPFRLSDTSRFAIQAIADEAMAQIAQGTFTPDTIITRSQLRLFTIAPVPNLRLKFIHISHRTLLQIMRHFGLFQYAIGPQAAPSDGTMHPVLGIFDWKKIRRPARSAFENAFTTDGFSAGIMFRKVVAAQRPPKLTLQDFGPDDLQTCHLWGADPGVTEIFVAVDGSSEHHGIYNAISPEMPLPLASICPVPGTEHGHVLDPWAAPVSPCLARCAENPVRLHDPAAKSTRRRSHSVPSRPQHPMAPHEHERHEIRRMSAAEFDHLAGYHRTNTRIKQWKQMQIGDRTISNIESTIPSAKTAQLGRMTHHIHELLAALPILLSFYGLDHQALRFLNYRGKQKAASEMINILVKGGRKYPRPDDDTIAMRTSVEKPANAACRQP
ncbi:hypothetical protein BC940DRAFT_24084 [Gongronella butleri]|nr:hypothetical protein BC940DRAFT_24084 [Gongronella butleri]